MKTIEIDLDVNRAIENGRLSFDETGNQILRRLLGIDVRIRTTREPVPRAPRSSGAYSTSLGGVQIEANSLKELMRRSILVAEKQQSGFIAALAGVATPKGRYIVAMAPEGLYPKSPQLVEYAEKLDGEWWFDSNVGRSQVLAYLRTCAKLLNLPNLPTLQKRSEKTALTPEDLGL